MSSIAERLAHAIDKSGLSYRKISELSGVAKSAVQRYAKMETEKIPVDRLKAIANAIGADSAYIMGWTDAHETDSGELSLPSNILPVETRRFPLLGNVACGEPIFADEMIGVYIDADASIHADFCLRASGDSMINARISDGDIVFIRQQDMVDDGEIAAVLIGDEATLKRVYYDRPNNIISLFAENPKYPTLRYSGAELDQIRILGKAVACLIGVR